MGKKAYIIDLILECFALVKEMVSTLYVLNVQSLCSEPIYSLI